MIELDNRVNIEIDLSIMEQMSMDLTSKDIELILINDSEIREINKKYRNKDSSTDVLSFPYNSEFSPYLGSIVISVETAQKVCKEIDTSINNELNLLYLHGLLHILGYDHEKDDGQMRKIERELASKYKIKNNLINRSL